MLALSIPCRLSGSPPWDSALRSELTPEIGTENDVQYQAYLPRLLGKVGKTFQAVIHDVPFRLLDEQRCPVGQLYAKLSTLPNVVVYKIDMHQLQAFMSAPSRRQPPHQSPHAAVPFWLALGGALFHVSLPRTIAIRTPPRYRGTPAHDGVWSLNH